MRTLMTIFAGCLFAAIVVFGSLMYLDESFNAAFWKWCNWTRWDARQTYGDAKAKMSPDDWTLVRQAARQMTGRCEELAKEQAQSADTLLGIAFIHKYFPDRRCPYDVALERVLTADPCNLAATAMKTEFEAGVWLARAQYDILAIDRILGVGQVAGPSRIRIGPDDEPCYSLIKKDDVFAESGTSPVLGSKGGFLYYVNDPAAARGVLVGRIWARLPQFVEKIDAAAAQDPDNGFYDYLKARLCFEMWQREKGLEYVEGALGKKVVENYVIEARAEAMRIMKSERYPKICRDYIATAGVMAPEYVEIHICKSWLEEMMRERRVRSNLAGAREMGQIVTRVREQCGIRNDDP